MTPVPRAAVLLALVACGGGAGARGSWLERDPHAPLGTTTATGQPARASSTVAAPAGDDEDAVLAALERAGNRAPAAALALRAARLAHHRGDDAAARAWIARAQLGADAATVSRELTALATEVAADTIDPAAIAVLLPLTGKYGAIGRELRVAIELAPADGTHWKFLDTRGEPDGAIAAVDAAAKAGAVGILGPVGEREAIAAARAAARHGLPIALLAPGDGADASAGVFRLVWSPADEGRAVARVASRESFPTVAVLAPRDDIGAESAEAFVAEARALGLSVTAQGSYDPTGGNLEPDLKDFLELLPAKNPRLAAHLAKHGAKGWSTFSPDIPYSLLYVPDRYDRAALVAAFLPFYNVELRTSAFPDTAMLEKKHGGRIPQVVQLVGGGGWNHPSLPIRGGDAVQGALIVDAWTGPGGGDLAAQLDAAFQQRAGRAASSAAAQAYDAATLVAAARATAAQSQGDERGALRRALAVGHLDDGACGPAQIGADGEIERAPGVLEVDGDQLVLAP